MLSTVIGLYAHFYVALSQLTGGYGIGIVILSLLSFGLLWPLLLFAGSVSTKEQDYQNVLNPQIAKYKTESDGEILHRRIQKLYRRYSYHPIYAVRKLSVLFVQLPFLILTYYMLSHLKELSGQPFLFIRDLGAPDALLHGINILPFTMTIINVAAALTMKYTTRNDILRSIGLSIFFLVILYNLNSSLLLYWNINNLLLLIKNLVVKYKFGPEVPGDTETHSRNTVHEIVDGFAYIRKYFQLRDVFLGGAYVFLILGIQEACYLIVSGRMHRQWDKNLILCSGLTLILTVFSILSRTNSQKSKRYFLLFTGISFLFFIFLKYVSPNKSLIFWLSAGSILLLPVASVLAYIFVPKNQSFNSTDYFLLGITATLAGLSFHWSNNADLLFPSTVAMYFSAGLVFSGICCLLILPFAKSLPGTFSAETAAALFIITFIMIPTVHSLLIWEKALFEYLVIIPPLFFIFFYTYRKNKTFLYVFFLTFLILNSISVLTGATFHKDISSQRMQHIEKRLDSLFAVLPEVTERPNVYLLTSESTSDLKTLEMLGVEISVFKDLLDRFNFKIYDSTYTLGNSSLSSMAPTLNMDKLHNIKNHNLHRLIIGGESLANKWFQQLGYETSIVTKPYMTGPKHSYDKRFPEVKPTRFSSNSIKLDYLVVLLKGIAIREFKFDIEGLIQDHGYQSYKHNIITKDKNRPVFVYYHGDYPKHSQNSGKCRDNEVEIYNRSFRKGVAFLKEDLETIERNDPNAIVIVMGDHGPYLTGDCLMLEKYDPEEVTELMLRDRFGTIMAIRWPDTTRAKKYDKELLINQNVFPILFSYLYDSPIPLALKVPAKVTLKNRTIENGRFLPLGVSFK